MNYSQPHMCIHRDDNEFIQRIHLSGAHRARLIRIILFVTHHITITNCITLYNISACILAFFGVFRRFKTIGHRCNSFYFNQLENGTVINPPLGVEFISEFQEFQESFKSLKNYTKYFQKMKTRRENQKTKNVRSSCIYSASNSISSCSIDFVLQIFNFPHLSIHQEVVTTH